MDRKPPPLGELLTPDVIQKLALPSNYRYGKAIYTRRAIEFIEFSPLEVRAWIGGLDGSVSEGGSQRRRTQIMSTSEGLQWHCAGNPKNHQIFCKHCVALAMEIWDRSHPLNIKQ